MFNVKLLLFPLLIVIIAVVIHIQKGPLFALLTPNNTLRSTQIINNTFPLSLHDPSGITFQLNEPPKRILSATLASDHILSALVSTDRIVAVTEFADYPSMSNVINHYPKQIARTQGEIESMLALQPDLIFIAPYSNPDTVRYLLSSDIAVVRLKEVQSFNDIMHNIRLTGNVTATQQQATIIIADLKERLHQINQQVKGQDKPLMLYYDLNGYSVGGNSLMDESIRIAGGINSASGVIPDGEHKISEEIAISLQPEIIVMNKWVFNAYSGQPTPRQQLTSKKAWENVPAVKNDRVYELPGTWLRSVSQHRILGVEALLPLVHPNLSTTHTNQIVTNEAEHVQAAP